MDGVRLKIDWADQHITNLQTEIRRIHDTYPHTIVRDADSDPERVIARVRFAEGFSIPDTLGLVAGDAAHAIRSALDYFAAHCVTVNGGDVGIDTAFPVWRKPGTPTTEQTNGMVGRKIGGASKPILDAVKCLEPWSGGNEEFIWKLDQLDVVDKHRKLLLVVASYERVGYDPAAHMRSLFPDTIPADLSMPLGLRPKKRCPLEDGAELFSVSVSEAEHWNDMNFTFDIAFCESGVSECEPAVPTLAHLRDRVRDLIETLAALL